MEKVNFDYWADVLHQARIKAQPIPQISKELTGFSRSDAYKIQETQGELRFKKNEIQMGWKMGLTSEAKRLQMNLESPLYGYLTDKMQISNNGFFKLQGSIHPKIEPEVAFLITQDLKGKVTREQVLKSCGGVCAALEILDSRYEQFKYFSMEDVIADNSSSSHFVLGSWEKNFANLDLANLNLKMLVNGELVQMGVSKDISGDPVVSIIQLCELLSQRDQYLKAGSVVLAGAATVAESLKSGMKIELVVDHLSKVAVTVLGSEE